MRGSVLVRLGRDSSVKALPNGTAVANLAAAYNVGYGENKRTVWIDATVFGTIRSSSFSPCSNTLNKH